MLKVWGSGTDLNAQENGKELTIEDSHLAAPNSLVELGGREIIMAPICTVSF